MRKESSFMLTFNELEHKEIEGKKTKKVVIIDFDDTISSYTPKSNSSPYLVGGEAFVSFLTEFKTLYPDVAIVIATHKNEDVAIDAHKFLRDNNISDYFDFLVYGRTEDSKYTMLEAIFAYFKKSGLKPNDVIFVDDSSRNCESAKQLELKVVQIWVSQLHSQEHNHFAMYRALQHVVRFVEGKSDQSKEIIDAHKPHFMSMMQECFVPFPRSEFSTKSVPLIKIDSKIEEAFDELFRVAALCSTPVTTKLAHYLVGYLSGMFSLEALKDVFDAMFRRKDFPSFFKPLLENDADDANYFLETILRALEKILSDTSKEHKDHTVASLSP